MLNPHVKPEYLAGKTIDIHSHLGVSLKAYANMEYPYAQSIEGLFYRQKAAGVDVNVVFPFSPDLFFEPALFIEGRLIPAKRPLSEVPYGVENRMMMHEIFTFCPEIQNRFLPFVCIDPGRKVEEQIRSLIEIGNSFPIYGIKVCSVLCQSRLIALIEIGRDFLDFARERNIPFLFHTTADPRETYSQPSDAFAIIEQNPDLRFCLAHCIGFHKHFLQKAHEFANVWVDTSALKIQVQLAHEGSPVTAQGQDRMDGDYSDCEKILLSMVEQFPETMVWGSDSPAYVYICRRMQAEGLFEEFRLKAVHEDEKAALDALPETLRSRVCNINSLQFLFGES